MNHYLKASILCWATMLIICVWWLSGCASGAIEGTCIPKAFYNATAWGISSKSPVYIIEFLGHWQSAGYYEGDLHFLNGDGWHVWPDRKEARGPMVRIMNLQEAMEWYIKRNKWIMPSDEEMKRLQDRIRDGSNS